MLKSRKQQQQQQQQLAESKKKKKLLEGDSSSDESLNNSLELNTKQQKKTTLMAMVEKKEKVNRLWIQCPLSTVMNVCEKTTDRTQGNQLDSKERGNPADESRKLRPDDEYCIPTKDKKNMKRETCVCVKDPVAALSYLVFWCSSLPLNGYPKSKPTPFKVRFFYIPTTFTCVSLWLLCCSLH